MALADWANGYIPIITRRHFFTKHPTHFLQQGFASENYFRVKRSNYGIFYKSVKISQKYPDQGESVISGCIEWFIVMQHWQLRREGIYE